MPYNIYRVQVVLQGPAENQFVNTWHVATANAQAIDDTAGGILEGNKVLNPITSFYGDWVSSYSSSTVAQAGTAVKIYNVTNPVPPHPPVYTYVYNTNPWAGGGAGEMMPWEVSVCLSFQAFLTAGTNRARRRGRVYLGPLTTDACEWDTTGYVRVNPSFRAAVISAYQVMVDDLLADGYETGPYSKVDGVFHNTATAWVDDAFDTQRRRGQDPVARTSVDRTVDNTAWV